MDTLKTPSSDAVSPTPSVTSVRTPQPKPSRRPPRLVFADPNLSQMYNNNPYTATINMTAGLSPETFVDPYGYPRKASNFMFSQFNGIRDFTMSTAKSGLSIGEKSAFWVYNKISTWSKKWFTHIFLSLVLIIFAIGGAFIFATIEGRNEKIVVKDMNEARYELIYELREMAVTLPNKTSEQEWAAAASNRLKAYEDEYIRSHRNQSIILASHGQNHIWSFWNSLVYCGTVFTTIGYGHMCPSTKTGMALTIVYAIIGIPLFLIVLTDFGKLFTRCIKFLWSFVRRVYYTGNCRQVRKTAHVQEIFRGAQMMYDIATFRRPSMFLNNPEEPTAGKASTVSTNTPTTPAPSNFEIDDEFNLPISLAIFILVLYIFIGAVLYSLWEGWDFFVSFYFVFISMSTIGFGDYVPKHPVWMIASIIYLVFGLALMSMCINVVQVKLSDTFKQASAKIGATIGLNVADEDGSIITVPPPEVELPRVHNLTVPTEAEMPRVHNPSIQVTPEEVS